jgi:hypothetical protein
MNHCEDELLSVSSVVDLKRIAPHDGGSAIENSVDVTHVVFHFLHKLCTSSHTHTVQAMHEDSGYY